MVVCVCVVAVVGFDWVPVFPAASYAWIVYVYVVLVVSPVSVYEVLVVVVVCVPSLYMLYPAMPTLSVAGFQVSEMLLVVVPVVVSPVTWLGACVSVVP